MDGTDPFIIEYLEPHGHKGNVITYRDYADAFYGMKRGVFANIVCTLYARVHAGDFLNYTQQKNGPHCLIWSRPVDSFPLLSLGNQSLGLHVCWVSSELALDHLGACVQVLI